MKNLSSKQTLWAIITILVVGFAFLIWGGHVYNQYPGIKEAKHITWLATKSAWIPYTIAVVILYGGYFIISKKS